MDADITGQQEVGDWQRMWDRVQAGENEMLGRGTSGRRTRVALLSTTCDMRHEERTKAFAASLLDTERAPLHTTRDTVYLFSQSPFYSMDSYRRDVEQAALRTDGSRGL